LDTIAFAHSGLWTHFPSNQRQMPIFSYGERRSPRARAWSLRSRPLEVENGKPRFLRDFALF
jgi:hypothetical protein